MKIDLKKKLIGIAQGKSPTDLLLKNARVLNVFTGEVIEGNVAVAGGYIVGVGDYTSAIQVADLAGKYLVPGFVNAHCHVESSMVLPGVYCAEELRWGTTTLITDPHEVANVAGVEGIKYMLDATQALPVNYYVQLPSCVPATPFEHAGAVLDTAALASLWGESGVLGLGEMMNYPGVLNCDTEVMKKLDIAEGRVIDGHAPGLSGLDLQAYVLAGIHTDHESTAYAEVLEKTRAGMAVLVREGSACKDLEQIIAGAIEAGLSVDRMAFCTDDKHIADIRREGTIRQCIQKSISLGLNIADAYRMASYNAAQIFGLKEIGAIAPGFKADLVVLDDLEQVSVQQVYKDGQLVVAEEILIEALGKTTACHNSVCIATLDESSFTLPKRDNGIYPVVGLVEKQIVTTKSFVDAKAMEEGLSSGKLCKLAVVERHHATGNIGVGLLCGYGLANGAIASTVGHDSHNLIVAGDNDRDMLIAAKELQYTGGGYALVKNGMVEGTMPLPVYGLMNNGDVELFINNLEVLIKKAHAQGIPQDIDPFITLSFLALPVIPALRVTDMGVFDTEEFRFI
ncbi:MAG: adenine deaminase [Clostridiales bacterium]|nr:adenine deaminase [Clostridiales bacterium]